MRMLCSTVVHSPPSDQNCELRVAYHHLSEAEHRWNYTCQQLDLAHEKVDIYTHRIIDLEHAFETQHAKIEERVETIASVEQ
jgi:hypothetical protein